MPKRNRSFTFWLFIFSIANAFLPSTALTWLKETDLWTTRKSGFCTGNNAKQIPGAKPAVTTVLPEMKIPPTLTTRLLRYAHLKWALPSRELSSPEPVTTYSIPWLPQRPNKRFPHFQDNAHFNTVSTELFLMETMPVTFGSQMPIIRRFYKHLEFQRAKGLSKTASLAMAKAFGKLEKPTHLSPFLSPSCVANQCRRLVPKNGVSSQYNHTRSAN